MTLLDWIVVAVVAWGALRGLAAGFVGLIAGLAASAAALILASRFEGPVSVLLNTRLDLAGRVAGLMGQTPATLIGGVLPLTPSVDGIVHAIAFVLVAVVVLIPGRMVLSTLIGTLLPLRGMSNRVLGLVVGGVEHMMMVALFLGALFPLAREGVIPGLALALHRSVLAGPLMHAVRHLPFGSGTGILGGWGL